MSGESMTFFMESSTVLRLSCVSSACFRGFCVAFWPFADSRYLVTMSSPAVVLTCEAM